MKQFLSPGRNIKAKERGKALCCSQSASGSQPLLPYLRLLSNCLVGRDLRRSLLQHKLGVALISNKVLRALYNRVLKSSRGGDPSVSPGPFSTLACPPRENQFPYIQQKPLPFQFVMILPHPPDTQSSEEFVSNFSTFSPPVLER